MDKRPVIFLAFANDRQEGARYLRNLPVEAKQLGKSLNQAKRDGLCDVVERMYATAHEVFDVFQSPEYRNQIAIFHFGGHANGYQLLMESAEGNVAAADAKGFSSFLGHQQGLQLVFLNGCSTQQQVQGILDAGVSAVIATSRSIDDQVATDFSARFYHGLAGGASISKAYDQAVSAIRTDKGGETRGLYFKSAESDDVHSADQWPWEIVYREGAQDVAGWNLPDAVENPLFQLPPLPVRDLPQSPFRGLEWFDRDHAAVFFGRGYQIRELYLMITDPLTDPIILYYGQSGVGKSSLLDAGLIPRLVESDLEVRYLRRSQLEVLESSLNLAFLPEGLDQPANQAWATKEAHHGKPLVVIVDQLEEVFTRPISDVKNELSDFLDVVVKIFGNAQNRPKGKLILSFRKEWLAEVEGLLSKRGLPFSKLFLQRLDKKGIVEAVRGPARDPRLRNKYRLDVDDDVANVIGDDLISDRDTPVAPTLQILLTRMWEAAKQRDNENPRFDVDLYTSMKKEGILLSDFLDRQVAKIRESDHAAVETGLLLDLLAIHTTSLGTADQQEVSKLEDIYSHHNEKLSSLIQQCRASYLLTTPKSGGSGETITRLGHDTLAPLIRSRFEQSDLPGQRARRILENRKVDWTDGKKGSPLDAQDLQIVEVGSAGTRKLDRDEQRLLEASREIQRLRRRNRQMIQAFGVLAVITITGFAIFAWVMWGKAEAATELAQKNFADARDTVKDFYLTTSQSRLLKQPGFEQLRIELLEKAKPYFERWLVEKNVDSDLTYDIALGHLYLGQALSDQISMAADGESANDYSQAIAKFDEALKKLNDLEENEEVLKSKSDVRNEMGKAFHHEGKWPQAESAFKQMIELREKLVKKNTNVEYQRLLANAHMNFGIKQFQQSVRNDSKDDEYLKSAYEEMARAQEIRMDQMDKHVDNSEVRYKIRLDLGKGHRQLARVLLSSRRPETTRICVKNNNDAIKLLEELRKEDPANEECLLELAKAYFNSGAILHVFAMDNESKGETEKSNKLRMKAKIEFGKALPIYQDLDDRVRIYRQEIKKMGFFLDQVR